MSIQRCKQTSGTLLMQYNIRILGMMPSGHQSCDEIATDKFSNDCKGRLCHVAEICIVGN